MLDLVFWIPAAVAIVATLLAVTNYNPVHGLLYLIVSLLAVAMIFFRLGAPFAGILEVIVYAGAIMVLFVFVVMMLNLGRAAVEQEKRWLRWQIWAGPALLCAVLICQLWWVLWLQSPSHPLSDATIDAKQVGVALFGPYLLAVELASMMLLAALVAAFHLGRHD